MKKTPKATIQIRIDASLLEWIDRKAAEEDRSRSWIINDCLQKANAAQYPQQHGREAS
ncbi:CopG family ribbon-helix-helix protein [Synergistes jonesii]|uniref:CopG family ribbon-helix-helix protein n=1 Tax=Synergistes jonesii TaxID=2754 RepID=UPI00332C5973